MDDMMRQFESEAMEVYTVGDICFRKVRMVF